MRFAAVQPDAAQPANACWNDLERANVPVATVAGSVAGRRCYWVRGGVEPDRVDARQLAADDLVGQVLQLVKSADRHRRVAGHGCVDIEPVPGPTQPHILYTGNAWHRTHRLLGLLHQAGVDPVQQTAPD